MAGSRVKHHQKTLPSHLARGESVIIKCQYSSGVFWTCSITATIVCILERVRWSFVRNGRPARGDIAPRQIRRPPEPEPRGARRLEQIVQPRRGVAALRHLAEVRKAEGESVITYKSPLNALKDSGIQLEKAAVGPTSGPTRRLSH